MRLPISLLILGMLLVAGCTVQADPFVENVDPATFRDIIADEEVFVLDVHIPEQEHVPGTDALIPHDRLAEYSDLLPADKDTPIAVYCRSGSMSGEASQALQDLGYTRVYNLEQGLNSWKESSLATTSDLQPSMLVYKSAYCGCCEGYIDIMDDEGISISSEDVEDLDRIKRRHNVPKELESCHTGLIGPYAIEGHVPLEAIQQLLRERPDVDGIALPEMPVGSPGMDGAKTGEFIIYSFKDGKYEEFARV